MNLDPETMGFMSTDAFASLLGVELVTVEEGRAVARMKLEDRHRNFMGMVHGGAIFGLADVAFGAAANSGQNRAMAFHISIEYLAAAGDTPYLEAEVKENGRAGRAGRYCMEVRDAAGRSIAVLNGWAYLTSRPVTG
jgi:acyl-CoA thioesterase